MLELELEQWREALEKRGVKVSRAKPEYMCLNGTPLGSVKIQSAKLPQVIEFKYLGNTVHSDGDMSTEINKRHSGDGTTVRRCQASYVCDKRVPPHVKGSNNKMIIHPAMLYGMETVPVTRSNVKKLDVTEMEMCSWACGHKLRDL